VATFITRLPYSATGIRLAVKDIIDMAGVVTTAGSRAVAEIAEPASADAPCLGGARTADAAIVGKVNLHELAYGASGVNEHYGTPVNPLAPDRVPGGSSSGSAVAVADGDADVAYGSDTGGSIRIPSAFCGTTGLKTTHGRVSLAGVWPLAPSLDTIGPMARDVAGCVTGMVLLEPGFSVAAEAAARIGRIRPAGHDVDPVIDAAVDAALQASGMQVAEVDVPHWKQAREACNAILDVEAMASNQRLLTDPATRALLGAQVAARLEEGKAVTQAQLADARAYRFGWQTELMLAMREVNLLALPTVPLFPPLLEDAGRQRYTVFTNPVNLAGFPAIAIPVPSQNQFPASLQLIGPPNSEALLLATAALIEAAAGYRRPG
jgi:amidase